jgi:hypothetical protein
VHQDAQIQEVLRQVGHPLPAVEPV